MSADRRSSDTLSGHELAPGAAVEPFRDDRQVGLRAGLAVGGVRHRPQHEAPLAVLEDVEELLRLRIAYRDQDRICLLGPRGQLALDAGGVRGLEHEQVAQDDAGDPEATCALALERADEV